MRHRVLLEWELVVVVLVAQAMRAFLPSQEMDPLAAGLLVECRGRTNEDLQVRPSSASRTPGSAPPALHHRLCTAALLPLVKIKKWAPEHLTWASAELGAIRLLLFRQASGRSSCPSRMQGSPSGPGRTPQPSSQPTHSQRRPRSTRCSGMSARASSPLLAPPGRQAPPCSSRTSHALLTSSVRPPPRLMVHGGGGMHGRGGWIWGAWMGRRSSNRHGRC